MSLRDLLILNLTLQVFDGLFSYQAFSLSAAEANPLRFRCNCQLGRDLWIALQENFGLCSAAPDIRAQVQTSITYKARIDCNGFSVWPCRGSFSLETFKLGITVHQYAAIRPANATHTVKY